MAKKGEISREKGLYSDPSIIPITAITETMERAMNSLSSYWVIRVIAVLGTAA
jgi:hypothetical protein